MIRFSVRRALLVTFSVLILWAPPLAAQLLPGLQPAAGKIQAPQTIPTFRQGNIEVSPVFLDGKAISVVSGSINVENSADEQVKFSSQERSYIVHGRLQRYLQNLSVSSDQLSRDGITDVAEQRRILDQQLQLYVEEATGEARLMIEFPKGDPPELIYTTTSADVARVREDSSAPDAIARRSAAAAKPILLDAWEERQKPYLLLAFKKSLLVLGAIAVLSTGMWKLGNRFRQRLDLAIITQRRGDDSIGLVDAISNSDIDSESRLLRRANIRRRAKISLLTLWLSLLYWGQWLLWMVGAAWMAGEFFFSRPAGNFILGISIRGLDKTLSARGARFAPLDWAMSLGREATIGPPLLILIVVIAMLMAIKASNALCDSYVANWVQNQTDERMRFRVPTLASALKAWLKISIYLLVGVIIFYHLHSLGAFTQTVTVFLGFFSFALSLASQNLIRDLINGLLILVEDQLAVGDVVIIGDHSGLVERMTLRVTQLRNLDGELISIPNGAISVIKNLTSSWSRINHTIQVAVSEDIDQAMAVMSRVATDLYHDPDWSDSILETPELLGVDDIGHQGVLIRILIKTKPFEQWPVGREFRRRLKTALDDAGISVGAPRLQLMQLSSSTDAQ